MPQEKLGLFDTPPTSQERRLALIILGVMSGAFLAILPSANRQLPELNSFVPVMDATMFIGELIIGTLLYAQASVFRSRALTLLASSYIFGTWLLIPHALAFPGAFAPDGLLGGVSTSAWLAAFWRLAFPFGVILYAFSNRLDPSVKGDAARASPQIAESLTAATALAALITLMATRWGELAPPLFRDRQDAMVSNLIIVTLSIVVLNAAALILLFRRRRSVLDMWLLVALATSFIQGVLNLPLHARFTVGWYGLWAMMLASNLIVMVALLVESNRLYARLALSTAAREREREARLLSTDAVAGAIAHEVGQPLTSIGLYASVGLSWLTRDRPDVPKAIDALRAIAESGQRSFEIISNIRAIVTRGPDWAIEFSLNDLVHETVGLLDRELAGAKVSLQLSLDDALPPLLANRVQMQQVIVNLVTNAIESLASARRSQRRIVIRSVQSEDDKILLEVSDSGPGIAPEDVWRIFETFHTTKTTGSGIGLALCRTIVEEHGGRIWASGGDKHGATFHVQLPRNRLARESKPAMH